MGSRGQSQQCAVSSFGVRELLASSPKELAFLLKRSLASGLDGYFSMTQATKRDMRFGVWNVTGLIKLGSLTAAAKDLASYKLDLVCLRVRVCVCV
jgi:hypothetical protein